MKKQKKTTTALPKKNRSASKPRPVASTADILSGAQSAGLRKRRVPSKWALNYRNLLELKSHLLEQMGQLVQQANEEADRFGMHMADAGTDSFDRDFALSLLSSDQNALYEIDQAIKRIESGTYGKCEETGKPIPRARLNAIPWARFTVQAQRQLERDGMLGRARFGQLGSIDDSAAMQDGDEDDEKGEKPEV